VTDCREFRDLLQEELDGRLAPEDASRLVAHVATCDACAEERRGLASLRATFRATPRPAAPDGFRDGVMASLPKGRVLKLPTVVGWIAAVAASIVVVVTLIPRERSGASVEREVAKSSPTALATDDALPPAAAESSRVAAESNVDSEADDAGAPAKKRANTKEVPSEFARRAGEKSKAPGAKADAAAPPTTRYVVFQDAAAAERFAKELAVAAEDASAPSPGLLGGERAEGRGGGGAAGARDKDKDKEGGYAPGMFDASAHRVLARTSIPVPADEAEFSARAAKAGGRLVPVAETKKFAEAVEPPAPAPGPEFERRARAPEEAKAEEAEGATAQGAPAPKPAPAPSRVVVVIVVVAPPAPEKK
jgi:hypothetical protein